MNDLRGRLVFVPADEDKITRVAMAIARAALENEGIWISDEELEDAFREGNEHVENARRVAIAAIGAM